jgi:hypothetical protein
MVALQLSSQACCRIADHLFCDLLKQFWGAIIQAAAALTKMSDIEV